MRVAILLLLLAVEGAAGQPQDLGWLKLDQAKTIASHTGKVILVYVACDPRTGTASCNGGVAERTFSDPSIVKRQEEFHFVRVCEKKTALSVKALKPHETIFLDPDGDEIFRSVINDAGSLEQAMSGALQRYSAREVAWGTDFAPGPGGRPLIVAAFDDEKGEGLKAFEDKAIVKFHDRIEFVKLPFKKDGEAAKKWGVTQTPAVFLCDGSKDNPEKNVLEKWTGKKAPAAVKAAIQKAFVKLEPKK